MRKNLTKRVVALTLAMVLVFGMAMSVCAKGSGSYSWMSNGTLYTASVSVNGSASGTTSAYSTSRTAYHYQGASSTVSAPAGYVVYRNWSNTFPTSYRTYLNYAMSNAGYPVNAALSLPNAVTVTVGPNATTGSYTVLAYVSSHSGSWWVNAQSAASVTEPMATNPQAANSGSMSGVPGTLTGYYTYIKVG